MYIYSSDNLLSEILLPKVATTGDTKVLVCRYPPSYPIDASKIQRSP